MNRDAADIAASQFDLAPVWRPARSGKPICRAAAPNDNAHRTARPGPSKVARMPSPVVFDQISAMLLDNLSHELVVIIQ